MRKVARFFSRLMTAVLVLALLLTGYVFFNVVRAGKDQVPSVFGFSFLRVATGSMEPTIPTGSLIIVRETDAEKIQVGDVICFYSTDPQIKGVPNTHRVVEVQQENGSISFVTQGDAAYEPDPYAVPADRLVGKYIYAMNVGKAFEIIHSPYFFFFALLLPLMIVIFVEILHVKRTALIRKNDAEEHDA